VFLVGLAVLGLTGCEVRPEEFVRASVVPSVKLPEAGPPAASEPGQQRLFQLLYAGEYGDAAWARGQRARVMMWLATMEFSAEELSGLAELAGQVQKLAEEDRSLHAALDSREQAAYGPIYAELEARLMAGKLSDPELQDLAERLEAARQGVLAEEDPWKAHLTRVQALLDAVTPWARSLNATRRAKLGESRYFLARRAAPLLNPAEYASLVGMVWDGGDFSSMALTGRPMEQRHMDIGGLWSLEALRSPPSAYLLERQVQAILVLALLEPALPEALRDWRLAKGAGPSAAEVPAVQAFAGESAAEAPKDPPTRRRQRRK
jgi:hypothetical protein